jgi:hypothetical protein
MIFIFNTAQCQTSIWTRYPEGAVYLMNWLPSIHLKKLILYEALQNNFLDAKNFHVFRKDESKEYLSLRNYVEHCVKNNLLEVSGNTCYLESNIAPCFRKSLTGQSRLSIRFFNRVKKSNFFKRFFSYKSRSVDWYRLFRSCTEVLICIDWLHVVLKTLSESIRFDA